MRDPNDLTAVVLKEVAKERGRQDAQWGEQNHPLTISEEERVSFADQLMWIRVSEEIARDSGALTWAWILLEEVYEAISAPSVYTQIEELTQVAAVAVAAIESLRRNNV